MIAVAGGILLAILALLVLSGLFLVVRDALRFVARFVRANYKFVGASVLMALAVLYISYITTPRTVTVTNANAGSVQCTGQCEYR